MTTTKDGNWESLIGNPATIGLLITIPSVTIIIFGMIYTHVPMPNQECLLGYTGTVIKIDENQKFTYSKPHLICDVFAYKVGDNYRWFSYSYSFQQKFGKPHGDIGIDCTPDLIEKIRFDNQTKQFVCPSGKYAKEFVL